MRAFRPQTRFLLRGSALLIGLLTLWWFALLGPMLYLLKGAAQAFVLIQETPAGDWTFRVPLERTIPATPQKPVAQRIDSIDFDMSRTDAIAFTFSLPVFWAIMLAAPGVRRNARPLLLGTVLMFALELLLLLVFAHITARNAASQLTGGGDAAGKWIRQVGEYLVVSLLPYTLPFAVALLLHRELRAAVFPFSKETEILAASRREDRAEQRRAKKGSEPRCRTLAAGSQPDSAIPSKSSWTRTFPGGQARPPDLRTEGSSVDQQQFLVT